MTPFFLENVFLFNSVFEKLCSSENTIFIVFSAEHSSCNENMYVEKQKFMKIVGCFLFLNMAQKICFGVFWFVFWF